MFKCPQPHSSGIVTCNFVVKVFNIEDKNILNKVI